MRPDSHSADKFNDWWDRQVEGGVVLKRADKDLAWKAWQAAALSDTAAPQTIAATLEARVQRKSGDPLFRSAYMIGVTDTLDALKINAAPQEATAEASSEVDREAGQVVQSGQRHSPPVPTQGSQNGPAGAAPTTARCVVVPRELLEKLRKVEPRDDGLYEESWDTLNALTALLAAPVAATPKGKAEC